MSQRRPNVLFISVDALRRDRMSLYGHDHPTTPVMDRMASHSVICEQNYAVNASTMGAFPSLLMSSPPLSYGGFDKGAVGRPMSIAERFQQEGYETYLLSTVHWVNRFFGYDRGVDHEQFLFPMNTLVGLASSLMRTSLQRFNAGELDLDDILPVVEPVVSKMFDNVTEYCGVRKSAIKEDREDFGLSPLYRDLYDHDRVIGVVEKHRREFAADKRVYIRKHFPSVPRPHQWIAHDWRRCRKPMRFAEELYYVAGNALLRPFNPRLAYLRERRFKRYPDANAIFNRIVKVLENRSHDQPFFIWTHLFDTHLPYCPGAGPNWYRNTPRHLSAVGHDPGIDPGLTFRDRFDGEQQRLQWGQLYEAAIHYVDEQIGRLRERLSRMGLLDDTLLVICGDHGEELGEHGDVSHHFRLYEHNVCVPAMFSHPDFSETRITGFTNSMDIAPSIAEFAGLSPHPEWEGVPVTSDAVTERDHVLMETFFGSPCDFANRPLYFAVRKGRFKFIWMEYRDPNDKLSPEGPQLYDVTVDPLEQNNFYRPDHPAVGDLGLLIAERMAGLSEIPSERIAAAFGPLGEEAVRRVRQDSVPAPAEKVTQT